MERKVLVDNANNDAVDMARKLVDKNGYESIGVIMSGRDYDGCLQGWALNMSLGDCTIEVFSAKDSLSAVLQHPLVIVESMAVTNNTLKVLRRHAEIAVL